jgi:hypothetical protein
MTRFVMNRSQYEKLMRGLTRKDEPGVSPVLAKQIRTERAWGELGREMGFDPATVSLSDRADGFDLSVFYATPVIRPSLVSRMLSRLPLKRKSA